MDLSKVKTSDYITKHFKWSEFLSGHPISALSKVDNWDIDWVLRPLIVAEITRDMYLKKTGIAGITISSGLRTPASNGGAKYSRHLIGSAIDIRPIGDWKNCPLSYEEFYGLVLQAQKMVSDCVFGIGYYPKSKAGIHIDSDDPDIHSPYPNREEQGNAKGLDKKGIRGYRWGSSFGWEPTLMLLYDKYEKNFTDTPKPFEYWYGIFKP